MDKFVFLSKKTGKPYTFSARENGPDADFCNDTTVQLEPPDYNQQIFCVDTLQAAIDALHFAPEWYNSDLQRPMISKVYQDDIKIARMEVKFHAVEYKDPMNLDKGIYDTRSLPWIIVKRMAPGIIKKSNYAVVIFDTKKDKVTRKELEERIGSIIYFGAYNKRELLAVCTAREEWADIADLELVCGDIIY